VGCRKHNELGGRSRVGYLRFDLEERSNREATTVWTRMRERSGERTRIPLKGRSGGAAKRRAPVWFLFRAVVQFRPTDPVKMSSFRGTAIVVPPRSNDLSDPNRNRRSFRPGVVFRCRKRESWIFGHFAPRRRRKGHMLEEQHQGSRMPISHQKLAVIRGGSTRK
jgi:hypothetical protein